MEQQNAAGAPAKRPTFLTVLCILSFIASGFAIIWSIIALLGALAAQALVSGAETAVETAAANTEGMETLSEGMSEGATEVVNATASVGMGMVWAYVIVTILATIIGLMGVIRMWKLKKSGFYLYTGASVASMIMVSIYDFSVGSLIIPIAFIVMYGLNLKHME